MKLVILIVLAVILLGGGGVGAWWFFLKAPAEQEVPMEEDVRAPQPGVLIEMDPLIIPLIRHDSFDRYLTYEMTLVVSEENQGVERVRAAMVKINNAFITYIHSLAAIDITPGVNDLDFLRQRLLVVAADVVGPGIVKDILFEHAFERPVR